MDKVQLAMLLTTVLLKICSDKLNFSWTLSFSTKYPLFSFLFLCKFLISKGEKLHDCKFFSKEMYKCKSLLRIGLFHL